MDNDPRAKGSPGQEGQSQTDRERSDAGPVLNYTITSDRDVLIVANQLIKRYGDAALTKAGERHVALWNEGAYVGSMVWNRIYNAILDFQHPHLLEEPDEGHRNQGIAPILLPRSLPSA